MYTTTTCEIFSIVNTVYMLLSLLLLSLLLLLLLFLLFLLLILLLLFPDVVGTTNFEGIATIENSDWTDTELRKDQVCVQ